MREVVFVIVGVVVGLAWTATWTSVLYVFGLAPKWKIVEDSVSRRERLKRLGKAKYIIIFGVLGPGLTFGLAMITVDFVSHRAFGLTSELMKLLFLAVCFGLFQGLLGWHREFHDPVPFPPMYPPAK